MIGTGSSCSSISRHKAQRQTASRKRLFGYAELPPAYLIMSCVHGEAISEAAPEIVTQILCSAQRTYREMAPLLPGVPIADEGGVWTWSEK